MKLRELCWALWSTLHVLIAFWKKKKKTKENKGKEFVKERKEENDGSPH